MHEMSIAQNILEIIRQHLPSDGPHILRAVKVRVGELSGVYVPSLEFCFGAIIQGTNLEGAALQIEAVTLTARCTGCGVTSRLEYGIFLCPSCGSTRLEILTGNELQVVEITVDDEESGEDTHGRHHN